MSSTKRGGKRNPYDLYLTPPWCVDALMSRLATASAMHMYESVWGEPCVGEWNIPATVQKYGVPLTDWKVCEIRTGKDYLTTPLEGCDFIVTNPPFSQALEFLQKSLTEADFVAYLLRLNFLGSQKRQAFWQENKPTHLYILSRRPSFTGKGTDSTEYAWYVWDRVGFCKDPPNYYVL